MIDLVWLFPVIMALAALINGLGCRKLGEAAGYISVTAMAATFALAVGVFLEVRNAAQEVTAQAMTAPVEDPGKDRVLHDWNELSEERRLQLVEQYAFVRTDPETPRPWDTSVRDGMGGHVPLWTWMEIDSVLGTDRSLTVDFALHVDQLTTVFLLFVSFVGLLVFIYATGYMRESHHGKVELDPGYARFFSYLALFAASMYILVLGANFVVMFIGWEGVGLCSYLLIGYYFDKPFNDKLSCADAGKKAFIANRVGDFGLLLAMFLIFWGLGTLDFQHIIHMLTNGGEVLPAGFGYHGSILTAVALLLLLGATGKSAQIPLFTWLPDAMAGPTPVSALIHAATMVTAGIYMLARLNVLYMMAPVALLGVAFVGALTALVAAYAALTQRGFKKILAYSTVSQLGLMFLAIGVGAFAAGIFHVFTHAFFKACLFLAAGAVIHALHHEEDIFRMGGLRKKMPKTWFAYLFATLAIAGIFPFAGFFSKDEILYMVHSAGVGDSVYMFLYGVGSLVAAFTAFYMGRSLVLVFHGKTRASQERFDRAHDGVFSMTGVLIVLAIASLVVGFLNVPSGIMQLPGNMNSAFHHYLEPITDRGTLHVAQAVWGYTGEAVPYGAVVVGGVENQAGELYANYHGPELMLAVLSVLIALGGIGLAFYLYGSGSLTAAERLARNPVLKPLWSVSWRAWKWDDFYEAVFERGAMAFYSVVLWIDENIVDGIVLGTGRVSRAFSHWFRRVQNGQVQMYGLMMFAGVCIFLVYLAIALITFLGQAAEEEQAGVSAPEAAHSHVEVTHHGAAELPVLADRVTGNTEREQDAR